MQQWIDINTKMATDSLATLKQFGDLNLKTTEAFLAQQKEISEGFATSVENNSEKLSTAKDPKDFFEMQTEMFQGSMKLIIGNWNKTVSSVEASGESYKKLSEESLKTAKSNMDQLFESAKKTSETATAAASKAVKSAK